MKKVVFIVILILTLIFTNVKVNAKDTVYSLNKYEEEKFSFIIDSYNKEGQKDGLIAAGEISKGSIDEVSDYDISQVIVVKYNYNGEIVWQLPYGKTCHNTLDYLEYTYDENGNINGYLIIMPKTYSVSGDDEDEDEDRSKQASFIKIDLNGKVEWEKVSSTEDIISISKIIPTHSENKVDGYAAIATTMDEDKTLLIKYDLELNIIWIKEKAKNEDKLIKYLDLEAINEDNTTVGYALIRKIVKNDDSVSTELLKLDSNGENEVSINKDLDKYLSSSLLNISSGIMLYGLTEDVKLKKGNTSYYMIKYNNSLEEEWESFGEVAIKKETALKMKQLLHKDDSISYIIMYTTPATESSTEVAEIDSEGVFVKKIKKILSNYYSIESFNFKDNVLYFVGQINCPADDDCEYNKSSLFLISDEDKVIEVEDNTSRNILIVMMAIVIGIVLIAFLRKRKA